MRGHMYWTILEIHTVCISKIIDSLKLWQLIIKELQISPIVSKVYELCIHNRYSDFLGFSVNQYRS